MKAIKLVILSVLLLSMVTGNAFEASSTINQINAIPMVAQNILFDDSQTFITPFNGPFTVSFTAHVANAGRATLVTIQTYVNGIPSPQATISALIPAGQLQQLNHTSNLELFEGDKIEFKFKANHTGAILQATDDQPSFKVSIIPIKSNIKL